jgi:Fe-S-cluster containining protein
MADSPAAARARRLVIPEGLRFSCQGCGLCCRRGWIIQMPRADRDRLLAHDWSAAAPEPAGGRLIVPGGGEWRFAVDEAGTCRFLGEGQRCRIHAELGYDAKVLACRLYPLYFVHCGPEVRVGAHFSCPAVVAGTGQPLAEQRSALRRLQRDAEGDSGPPPAEITGTAFCPRRSISWQRLEGLETLLLGALAATELPLLRRVVMAGRVLDLLEERYAEDLDEATFDALLAGVGARAREEAEHGGLQRARLGPMERMMFRVLTGLSTELAVSGLISPSFWRRQEARLARLRLGVRFLLERGRVPVGAEEADLRRARQAAAYPLDAPAAELIARYLSLRVATRAYFGRHGWGLGALHGARLLLSLYAVCVWLGRLHAAALGRERLAYEDAREAVMLVDHTFGHMAGLQAAPARALLTAINRPCWPQRAALYASLD